MKEKQRRIVTNKALVFSAIVISTDSSFFFFLALSFHLYLADAVADKKMTVDFKNALAKLEVNQLPENWEWIRSSTMAKVAKYNGNEGAFFKEFLPRNRLENIKSIFHGSRSERWIKQANIAKKEGFEVPEVLASGKFSNKNGFLITATGPKKDVP